MAIKEVVKEKKEEGIVLTNEQFNSLMSEIKDIRLEKEKKLKPLVEGQKYEGPRIYKYKFWSGKIVVEYEAVKKDKNRPLTFRNNFGKLEENHLMKLYLVDPESPETLHTEIVPQSDFANNHEYSEFYPVKRIETKESITGAVERHFDKETFKTWTTPKQEKYYVFDINGHEIGVAERILN